MPLRPQRNANYFNKSTLLIIDRKDISFALHVFPLFQLLKIFDFSQIINKAILKHYLFIFILYLFNDFPVHVFGPFPFPFGVGQALFGQRSPFAVLFSPK
jgi:hypothetical protein